MTLSADQIIALAPDASSAKAGSQLALASKWSNLGRAEGALWGECQGSGKVPYRTQIDLGEPAFKCSCPSRKFPCKHGLGLYLLLAGQAPLFSSTSEPQWVTDWLQSRQQRTEKKLETAAEKALKLTPEQAAETAAKSQKREEKRETKVARGLEELQTWLQDLAREGFSTLRHRGPAYWEGMAARMVDAQAGGLATRLRRAGGICFQRTADDWETPLAREVAAIYLLIKAYQRIAALPEGLQADVRAMVGWSVSQDELLAQPGVQDRWQVLAQHCRDEDRVSVRTSWLRGIGSGRWALVLHFSVGKQGFDKPLAVATEFDGELCFYPGAHPLRALIRHQAGLAPIAPVSPALPALDAVLASYADALASNPFLERYPLALAHVVPQLAAGRATLRCPDGSSLPVHATFRAPWQLLALSGGHAVTIIGEWDGHAFLPLSAWADGRLHNFESAFAA